MPTIGGVIKLEGESEYRKALSQINASLKTTSSELKLLSTQYDKDNQSVEGFTKQNKALEKQIEQQKEKIATLKGAVEDSTKAYGENNTKTEKWKQSLNNAEAELIKMQKQVDANNKAIDEMGKQTDDTNKELVNFKGATDEAGKSALSMGDIIKGNLISDAVVGGVKALANAAISAGKALASAVKDSAAYADEMLTLSTNTGIAVDKLDKYNTVSELIDVDTETLTNSMAKNIKSMTNASLGSEKVANAYKQLGVSVTNADGSLRDSETVYWELIDALGQVEDETTRDSLSMQILGKSAQDMNSLVKVGSKGFEELSAKAESMNATLSEDSLNALGDVDDAIQWLGATTDNTAKLFVSAMAPALTEVIGSVTETAASFNGLLQAIANGGDVEAAKEDLVNNIVDTLKYALRTVTDLLFELIVPLFDALITLVPQMLPQLTISVLATLRNLAMLIVENLPIIIKTLLECISIILETLAQPQFLPTIIETIVGVIPQVIAEILKMIPQLIGALLKVGGSLIEGLWYGISDKIEWIKEKIKGFGTTVLNSIKDIFGIHSPSRVMRDQVGKNLALGIGEGFTSEMSKVNGKIAGAIETDYSVGINASASGSLQTNYQNGVVSAFKEALKEFNADVVLDDKKVGSFVLNTVNREVFA